MPVSVVVGGQFGSEGKGKVALALAARDHAAAVIRVGGTNSGHTVIRHDGRVCAFRQLPAAVLNEGSLAILPAGSYIDVSILLEELQLANLDYSRVAISPYAKVIMAEHKQWEQRSQLGSKIGSTQSGTGAAVIAAAARGAGLLDLPTTEARNHPDLKRFVRDTSALARGLLRAGKRIVIEGTQGFGLSLLHGGSWPKATSRDTTAAAFVAEAGLSPLDVDDVTLVLRACPIRVAGDSGPLPHETTWHSIATRAGLASDYRELTTVTRKERRVAEFDADIVRAAILVNNPTRIVLNHLDYIDPSVREATLTSVARNFLASVEAQIGATIDWVGVDQSQLFELRRPLSAGSLRSN